MTMMQAELLPRGPGRRKLALGDGKLQTCRTGEGRRTGMTKNELDGCAGGCVSGPGGIVVLLLAMIPLIVRLVG